MLDLVEDKKPNDFSGEKIMRKNQYRVIVEWIYDLEKHKEFMSEEDYEVDEKGVFESAQGTFQCSRRHWL